MPTESPEPQPIPELDMPDEVAPLLRSGFVAVTAAVLEPVAELQADLVDFFAEAPLPILTEPATFWDPIRVWVDSLYAQTEEVAPEWRRAVSIYLATTNPFIDTADLGHGPGQRRVDAVLDVMDIPGSCHDIQQMWVDEMALLDEEARSSTRKAAELGVELVAGFLTGYGQDWAGQGVRQGMELLTEAEGEDFDVVIDDLARLVLITRVASDGLPVEPLLGVRRKLLQEEHNRAQSLAHVKHSGELTFLENRQILLFRHTRAHLDAELAEQGVELPADCVVPDLVGIRLSDAEAMLEALGLRSESVDTVGVDGTPRTIWSTRNWQVSDMSVDAGDILEPGDLVTLQAAKFSD